MINIEQIAQEHPQIFDYLALSQNDLITQREKLQEILKNTRANFKNKKIIPQLTNKILTLVKLELDICINRNWQVLNLIVQSVNIGNVFLKITNFDLVFDVINIEISKKKNFFVHELDLIIQQNQDINNSESIALRKIKNYLEIFEEELEERLLEIANKHIELRFVILSLLSSLELEPQHQYDDKDFKKYELIIRTERLAKKSALSELDKLDKYLEYCKQIRKRNSYYLEHYLDKQLDKVNQEFINQTKTEDIMLNLQDFDNIRKEVVTELENLCNYLSEKGMLDEASRLQKELSKVKENTYQIAFIATMKAGKSSLINAILGYELLPSLEKSCTGRLTYINHHDEKKIAHIKTKNNVLVISYRDSKDLEKYLNKYIQNNCFNEAEVYSSEKFQESINIKYINEPFDAIDENFDIYANQAQMHLENNQISIENIDAIELGSFINNKYVEQIKIDTPIQYLKKHIQLDGIQIVDTPGPNSAAHTDHKRITYNFIDKANVVIYVIDFTKFDIAGEDELLQEIKRQREKFNPNFYEKFFFVINKIDMHEAYKGATLEAKLNDIRQRIQHGYGYKVPDSHVIGVAAKPALLYRLDEQRLLDKERKKEFQKFFAPFLDLDDVTPESVNEAKNQVLQMSNIETLDNAIINYLKSSNQTKELIIDALTKAKIYLQDCERSLQESLGYSQKTLNELEAIVKNLNYWIQEAEADKDKMVQELNKDKKKLRTSLIKKYDAFGEDLLLMVDEIFQNIKVVKDATILESLLHSFSEIFQTVLTSIFLFIDKSIFERIQKIVEVGKSIVYLTDSQNKSEITKKLQEYNQALTETTRDIATKFEAELKTFSSLERQRIYDKAYKSSNQVINDLNQKLGETLNIEINTEDFVFPKFELESVIDKVETLYSSNTTGGGCCSSPRTTYSVKLGELQYSSKENIKEAVKEAKRKILLLTDEGIQEIENYLLSQINIQIGKLRRNLDEAITKRKTVGFNAQEEIAKLESELELVDERIGNIDLLSQITQNFSIK